VYGVAIINNELCIGNGRTGVCVCVWWWCVCVCVEVATEPQSEWWRCGGSRHLLSFIACLACVYVFLLWLVFGSLRHMTAPHFALGLEGSRKSNMFLSVTLAASRAPNSRS
jgi:hypothetical protein